MRVGGRGKVEGALDVDLRSGGGEEVGAAHDLGDPQRPVVHRRGQVIGVDAVGPIHDEVAGLGRKVDHHFPLHRVTHGDARVGPHPDRTRRARGPAAAGAGVGARPRLAAGAGAAERPAPALEKGKGGAVSLEIVPLVDHRAVPGQGEPLELAEDRVRRARNRPHHVHVVDANVPLAAPVPGAEVARDGGDHRAEVQWTVRGGSEAPAYRHCSGFSAVRWCRVTAWMRPFPQYPETGVRGGPGRDRCR